MSSFSSEGQSSHYDIYTGFWTNWSRGPVLGATITTPRQSGTIFIAILALFVSIVGTHFWNITCFCLHYILSSSKPQDALYHQRQATLRNSATGTSGLWALLMVLSAWRRSARGAEPCRRIMPLICIAVCHIVAFGVAGTFSSKIATAAGKEVLVSSSQCGILMEEQDPDVSQLTAHLYSYQARQMASYAAFSQQCYRNDSDMTDCRAFVKRNLPTTTTLNVTCPFNEDLCLSADRNIRFDTGYLDSNDDFGLNAPRKERVQLRRISTCAPITTKGYRQRGRLTNSNTSYIQYNYGTAANFWEGNNYTYRYPEITMEWELPTANTDYTLGGMDATVLNGTMNNTNTDFVPVPALQQTDADLHLIFLSANSIIFTQMVDDPWYSAHRNISQIYWSDIGQVEGEISAIVQDDAASVLACTVKEQYCNPNLPEEIRCAPFGGEHESAYLAEHLWTDEKQLAAFRWIGAIFKAHQPSMHNVVYTLGASALLARQRLSEGLQGALEDNQWQLEAEHWHATSLAAMQGVMKEVAAGPSDSTVEKWLARPNTTQEHHLCSSQVCGLTRRCIWEPELTVTAQQKIINGEYFNFSVLGLVTTIVLGGSITFISYTIAPVSAYVQRRLGETRGAYARLEWSANGTLQLQRMAHEELGMGTWDHCAGDVPVAQKGEKLATLDLDDLDHPVLVAEGRYGARFRKTDIEVRETEILAPSENSEDGRAGQSRFSISSE
ncbi:hypothetical protein B0J12DRAFT_622697 [Macrophomina phaseolina]|uniref:Cytochrome P450 n=1 Tax=Macrophomina phaseolina TaxID=35725 RepID=A0ABQ8GE30_9PEZI|nr:hypothetical protein B0J12DRAFT_622697 [Macrophomina phaseolina]